MDVGVFFDAIQSHARYEKFFNSEDYKVNHTRSILKCSTGPWIRKLRQKAGSFRRHHVYICFLHLRWRSANNQLSLRICMDAVPDHPFSRVYYRETRALCRYQILVWLPVQHDLQYSRLVSWS
jgi:hypothetical protein